MLIVGCGNVLRGDDAVGPLLVRALADHPLPPGVRLHDGGTAGMDVAFAMRGEDRVVVVDACRADGEPGTIYRVPGDVVAALPPPDGANLHAFRWDHALGFGRWLLKDEYPAEVEVYLVEVQDTEPGADLSPPVREALGRLEAMLLDEVGAAGGQR